MFVPSRAKLSAASSKIPSSKSAGKITNVLTVPEILVSSQESWIDQISSPTMFYKSRPKESPQLKGAQRRKSYTSATTADDVDTQSKVGIYTSRDAAT